MKEMRTTFTEILVKLAEEDPRIVLLEADLMQANGTGLFKQVHPARTVNAGVAEANMVGMAAGLSTMGKISVAITFACFASRRAYDQFFISGNYAKQNIKLIGSDPGVTAALNGGTHMAFEDIGLMRTIPNMVVCDPCDGQSMAVLFAQMIKQPGCAYMRLNRKTDPQVYNDNAEDLKIGAGYVIQDGTDVAIIASGVIMVPEAIKAAEELKKENISAAVIDMHTIKPLDSELVRKYADKTGKIVTCENHQVINGLGSAVAEVLAQRGTAKMMRVGVQDRFGQVGDVDYLKGAYDLTSAGIIKVVKKIM